MWRSEEEPDHDVQPEHQDGSAQGRPGAATRGVNPDLIEALFDEGPLSKRFLSFDRAMGLADVRRDVQRFRNQLGLMYRHELRAPCLEVENDQPYPVPLLLVPSSRWFALAEEDFQHNWLRFEVARRLDNPRMVGGLIRDYSPEDAREFFTYRLGQFLDVRSRDHRPSFRERLANAIGPPANRSPRKPPAFRFTLLCKRDGLQAFASPAYAVDDERVFGNTLTSPVEGWLRAGGWICGTREIGGDDVNWERGEYIVPDVRVAYLAGAH